MLEVLMWLAWPIYLASTVYAISKDLEKKYDWLVVLLGNLFVTLLVESFLFCMWMAVT